MWRLPIPQRRGTSADVARQRRRRNRTSGRKPGAIARATGSFLRRISLRSRSLRVSGVSSARREDDVNFGPDQFAARSGTFGTPIRVSQLDGGNGRPSASPSARRPCRNAATSEALSASRQWTQALIRQTFPDCASAESSCEEGVQLGQQAHRQEPTVSAGARGAAWPIVKVELAPGADDAGGRSSPP